MKKIKVVFMGTPHFAVPALNRLARDFTVAAVVTQPDRPRGRGRTVVPSPVKQEAISLGLPVLQPDRLKSDNFVNSLKQLAPDFLVTAAYGKILPEAVLEIPRYAPLNIHASLLPLYRGAAPLHRAVMEGAQKSGITVMWMDSGMDTGDIVLQEEVPLEIDDTTGELHDKLSALGSSLIVSAIVGILEGKSTRTKQNHKLATYAPPLTREEEEISWCENAVVIHNQVRGLNPWPGAYTWYNGKRLKVWSGRAEKAAEKENGAACGQVLSAGDEGILVGVGSGAYRILTLQLPGKKPVSAADFLRGNSLVQGAVLGGEKSD